MPIVLDQILGLRTQRRAFSWTALDAIRYALGVGFGSDPLDEAELPFVYERELKVLPSLATVVAWGIGPDRAEMGIDYTKVVHGAQDIVLHQPLRPAAEITAEAHVSNVYDKEEKGALIVVETRLFDAADAPLATLRSTLFARADGGFGGDRDAPRPLALPTRNPDHVVRVASRPDQALLFRLNGDLNPLHVDPQAARAAGFPRPILHGLATYGMTCKAVAGAFCEGDPGRIKAHSARFASAFYPGETLSVDLWREAGGVAFRADCLERDVRIIDNGWSAIG